VIVETIFDLPGVGATRTRACSSATTSWSWATTTLGGVMTCLGILVSDLLTAALDPRIRHG
jgi:ABC-type dipeptide/oligopeptide/nickel transport system permease component